MQNVEIGRPAAFPNFRMPFAVSLRPVVVLHLSLCLLRSRAWTLHESRPPTGIR
jgi:hypothetical protein